MTTTYVMEAVDNYNSVYGPQVSNDTAPANCIPDQLFAGMSYDAVRRKIMYVAYVCPNGNVTNGTGFALWNGSDSIASGATYDATSGKNLFVCEVDIDTRAVIWYDCWSSTSTVPASVFGDGTARRYTDTATTGQGPKVVDPRTGNVWMHGFGSSVACSIYLFRRADSFKQIISPIFDTGNHMTIRGIEADWVYLTAEQFGVGDLLLTPREITAAETTADYLLTYASYALPAAFDHSYNACITDTAGDMWWFSCKQSGTRDYALNKFTKPSAFVYPTPPIDGGFTDVTPWAAGTGPNSNAAAYTVQTAQPGPNPECFAFYLPATGEAALLSLLLPDNTGSGITDPNLWRLDCTYVDLGGGTFDYHEAFVTGYMTADWTPTAVAADAAYSVQYFFETNMYLDMNSYAFSEDYTQRALIFDCQPVVDGVVQPGNHAAQRVIVTYSFVSGSAPAVVSVYAEPNWDEAYPAYAAAIDETNPLWWSMPRAQDTYEIWSDIGLYDPQTNSYWTSSYQATSVYYLNPDFASRDDFSGNASPPFLRLSFGGVFPVPTGRVAQMWANIGHPQPTRSIVSPPVEVPVNTTIPTITGTAVDGQPLSAGPGSWTGNPTGFSYQWTRDSVAISGATSATYLLVTADVGADVAVEVRATNGAGTSAAAVSAPVVPTDAAPLAPVFTSPPFITGTGVVGSILTGHVGVIANNPTSVTYQWNLSGTPISGETSLTYVPVTGDIGADTITFTVSASNATAPTAVATSDPVTVTAAGGSDVPLADNTALYAMLNAGVGASGGQSYILAPGDYGGDSFNNYDFSSNPIVIKGQSGVFFEFMALSNCQGITWGPDINVYGHNGTNGAGVAVSNSSAHLTFDNVTMLTDAAVGGDHDGIAITVRNCSYITFVGTVGVLTIQGHGSGAGLTAPNDHVSFQGVSFTNINTDGIITSGCSPLTVNQCLLYEFYPNVGDHPDAVQWFSTTGNPNDDLVVTNSFYFQGIGGPSQGFFGAGDGTNHTFDTCAVWGGLLNSFSQSGGVNATWNNCFAQSWTGNFGTRILIRGGTVNATITNCTAASIGTYTPEGPYPGFTASGNTILPEAANSTDYTDLDAFLAANPMVPGRPY